jgi:hypothetical protein
VEIHAELEAQVKKNAENIADMIPQILVLLKYNEADRLKSCAICDRHHYWFDGVQWRCHRCSPSLLECNFGETEKPLPHGLTAKLF